MTRLLRDAFGDLVGDEPPMRLGVADVVAKGRRRVTRRRWVVSASVSASGSRPRYRGRTVGG
jgi:hypothetical protein